MKKILTLYLVAFIHCASFSQGYYLEFKMSSLSRTSGVSGNMKSYYQDGNSRVEMDMITPGLSNGGNMAFTGIILNNAPNTLYLLNGKNKTYTELATSSSEGYKDYEQSEYEVTVVGKEKVNGYNSTHVKVKVKENKLEQEMWTSTDISDYASYAKLKTKYTGKGNLFKALEAKGATGFPVRIITQEHGSAMQMDLVKAEKRSNPSSLFSLTGYTKSSGLSDAPGGVDIQELMKKMQNMSPEEREEMIKQMGKLYNKQPH